MKQKHLIEVLAIHRRFSNFLTIMLTPGFLEKLKSAISPDVLIFNDCFLYEFCITFYALSSGANHFEIRENSFCTYQGNGGNRGHVT